MNSYESAMWLSVGGVAGMAADTSALKRRE